MGRGSIGILSRLFEGDRLVGTIRGDNNTDRSFWILGILKTLLKGKTQKKMFISFCWLPLIYSKTSHVYLIFNSNKLLELQYLLKRILTFSEWDLLSYNSTRERSVVDLGANYS